MKQLLLLLNFLLITTVVVKGGNEKPDESEKPVTQEHSVLATWPNNYKWGIGLRLGEPTGITFKKFLGTKALELSVGRSGIWGYNYSNEFKHIKKFDDYKYLSSSLRSAVSFQGHYLFFKDLGLDGIDGFQWYFGFGGQIRSMTIDYHYQYKVYNNAGSDYHWEKRWEKTTETDFGVDGVIGLDYTLKDAPVSFFTDLILFMEVIDDPLLFKFQGGLGVRYNF